MKKILLTSIVFLSFIFIGTNHIYAKTEEDILAKSKEMIEINDKKYRFKGEFIKQIEKYLDKYEVTEEECDIVLTNVEEIINTLKETNTIEWNELSKENQTKITELVSDISIKTSIKATLTQDGILTVYEDNGEEFTKISNILEERAEKEKKEEEQSTTPTFILVGGAALLALTFMTRKVIKTN